MCGIVGYTGTEEAYPIVIKGLKRLEYRGYDSAGIALNQQGNIQVLKKAGKVEALEKESLGKNLQSFTAIGHTRWATHGEPSDRNAHPHISTSGEIAMVHNGIIENYEALKQDLLAKGYQFKSDTDSEVLLYFIEDIKKNNNCNLEEAVRIALKRVVGTYVILLVEKDAEDTIIAARKGSPLVIGIGKGAHYLGSDASPMLEYTKEVVYINDYELAIVKPDELILKNLGNEQITPFVQKLDLDLAAIEKGGYDHFMIKEIFEQPQTIYDSLRGRLDAKNFQLTLSGITQYAKEKGALIIGVVNVVGSSIARISDAGAYTHAGPEIGVASTKAFTAQLTVLHLIALKIAELKGSITRDRLIQQITELAAIPDKVHQILQQQHERIKEIAKKYKDASDFLFLGRGYNFPIALEGALKLKEISYIHAEGYPAAEMKHGPIALVDENLPVVIIATKDQYHEKVRSNIQEIRARKGQVIALITEGDDMIKDIAQDYIEVPQADEMVSPILATIPLQLLSYYIGIERGVDVDKPRNLAKSVTVE